MQTYQTILRVGLGHIDSLGHLNWRNGHLAMAEEAHFYLRDSLGLGLKELLDKHGLALVMRDVLSVKYRGPFVLHELVFVELKVWIPRPTLLQFEVFLKNDDFIKTSVSWTMALVSQNHPEKPIVLPPWIVEKIGQKKPSQ